MKCFVMIVVAALLSLSPTLVLVADDEGNVLEASAVPPAEEVKEQVSAVPSAEEVKVMIAAERRNWWKVWREIQKFKLSNEDRKNKVEAMKVNFMATHRKVSNGLAKLDLPYNDIPFGSVTYTRAEVESEVQLETDKLISAKSEISETEKFVVSTDFRIRELEISLQQSKRRLVALISELEFWTLKKSMGEIELRLSETRDLLSGDEDSPVRLYLQDLKLEVLLLAEKSGKGGESHVPLGQAGSSHPGDFVQATSALLEAHGIQVGPVAPVVGGQ